MSLLSFVPFCVPFDKRVDIFYSIVNEEFKQFQNQTDQRGLYRYFRFSVRRERLYEDAFSEMSEQNFPGKKSNIVKMYFVFQKVFKIPSFTGDSV